MSFSEDIKRIRRKAFMTQEDFAKEIGVSFATVNRWETGKAKPNLKTMKLIEKLKKKFTVLIITNNTRKRIIPYQMTLGVDAIYLAMKPFTRGLRKVQKKYGFQKSEMIMIGDQLVTDIKSGVKFGIKTILVDPLGKKDLKITSFNRFIENQKISKYKKENLFERGRYYE